MFTRVITTLALLSTLVLAGSMVALGQIDAPVRTASSALHATWKGPIGPASTRYLEQAIAAAEDEAASVLIFELDTPGGLVTSTRDMISAILRSKVPVIGYVSPPGGHAASAGTYIIYATHIAAMAPGTNIGAATPIQIGGGLPGLPSQDKPTQRKNSDETETSDKSKDKQNKDSDQETEKSEAGDQTDASSQKAINDAVAYIRSLAELRERNADWAESAVRQAASLSAREALNLKVVDVIAEDVASLLEAVDGRRVHINKIPIQLDVAGSTIKPFEQSALIRFLALLTDPNIALILMMIGIYGIIFEFSNPGSIGPGVIGAICLVLGLYALNQLPIDYAGLALVLLGVALMVAEAVTPTFGILGLGGLAAFVTGAIFLTDTNVPAFRVSSEVIVGLAISSMAILTFLLAYLWRSQSRTVVIGEKSIAGTTAEVIDWSDGNGHVWFNGERWQARAPRAFKSGEIAVVDRMDGLTLILRNNAD